ncbi:MAG: TetR/AcrR family transcriptional regulator [Spirochaeta sp.]|jgi:AcrR family transcriptional regulator|nr:TetR/AcrR family transcriptional regulator [Spirochaeta sp.]
MANNDDTSAKTRILTVSRQVFAQKGYEAVGIQEICALATVTKPTLYYHFGNKAGLLSAVCADARSAFLRALGDQLHYSGDLVRDVRTLFRCVSAFAREDGDRFQLVLQMLFPPAGSTVGAKTRADAAAIATALEQFFQEAAGGHGNIRGKEAEIAEIFLGHAIALTRINAVQLHGDPSERAIRAAQTFLYGIF